MGVMGFLGYIIVCSHHHRQNMENRTVPESLQQGKKGQPPSQNVPSQDTAMRHVVSGTPVNTSGILVGGLAFILTQNQLPSNLVLGPNFSL